MGDGMVFERSVKWLVGFAEWKERMGLRSRREEEK